MRTCKELPKKYNRIKSGHIDVIDDYAYAVYHKTYDHRDYVYRITRREYYKLRHEAQYWECYKAAPYEWNMQLQIWIYIHNEAGITPYIQTTRHL